MNAHGVFPSNSFRCFGKSSDSRHSSAGTRELPFKSVKRKIKREKEEEEREEEARNDLGYKKIPKRNYQYN